MAGKSAGVVLLNPDYTKVYKYVSEDSTMILPPLGLAYIAAVLKENGVQVSILDLAANRSTDEEARKFIESRKPAIVGMTATTNTMEEVYSLAGLVKSVDPKIKVVVGGSHPTILPEQTLRECRHVDVVVRGEGEYTILGIAKGLAPEKIAGITYRKGNSFSSTPNRPLNTDLDRLPFPARDLLPMEKYKSIGVRRYPFATIISSRGCPYSCIFCTNHMVHGRKFRYRSPENFVAEIDELVEKYGIRELNILDDNFTMLPERVSKICRMLIERNYDLKWKLGNGIRADRVTLPMLREMKEAGCYLVAFGVESGNERVLKNINKGESLDDIRRAVAWARKAGLETEGFFILGNDGDTDETMQETIDFAKELDLDIAQFQVFIPLPGSLYTEKIKREGRLFAQKWNDYNAFNKPIFSYGCLTPELLQRMQKKAYRDYYYRPKMILRKILEVRSPRQLKMYMGAALGILRMGD